jgi:hypothetical protein
MKRTTLTLLALLPIVSAPAWAETKTVSWYVSHPDARTRVKALCLNNPGEAKHVPDCANASAADPEVVLQSMPRERSLIQMCSEMDPLFQAANRCGRFAGK